MNKFTLLLLVMLCSLSGAVYAQGWQPVEIPTNDNINGIFFVNPDTGFVITNKGKMLRTFDSGNSWDIFDPAPGYSIEDLHFINSDIGYICGQKGLLLKTADGGYTWNDLLPEDTISWFFDIEILDDQTGLVVGMSQDKIQPMGGICYRTENSGKNWKKQKNIGLGYSKLLYLPDKTLYLVSFGKLNYSTDKGKSWDSYITIEGSPARSVSLSGKTGIICGLNGMCGYSMDGGKNWFPSQQNKTTMFIAAQLIDENRGFIGGSNSTVLYTADGGKTWNEELMIKSFDVFEFYLVKDRLYAGGSQGGLMYKVVK